jgi:phosphoadenosine phosphosulfate reductase
MHAAPQRGLDRDMLRGLRRPRHDCGQLTSRIRAHLDAHDGYLAFSGGKDSLVTLHLALGAEPNIPVAFFDSGLEFPETYAYLAALRENWHLHMHWLRPRYTTLEVLHASAAWDHHRRRPAQAPDLHDILITEPAALAHAEHGQGEIWGVRAQESRGRAAMYANALRAETARDCGSCCPAGAGQGPARRRRHGGVIRRADGTIAFGPAWDWTSADVWEYIQRNRLPVNPVYAKLRRLGAPERALRISHMLDGNLLEQGRVTWLRRGWPGLFEEIASVLPRLREYV